MLFDQYRVPRAALLNRTGDVSETGIYVSPFKDKKKRLGKFSIFSQFYNVDQMIFNFHRLYGCSGASLGTLSAGRVGISSMATANLIKSVTIGIRYSAVRRQFGPEDSTEELPVIEYQLQVKV